MATIIRDVGQTEFRGILNGTIPVYDQFGTFNEAFLAIVEKDSKYGVVDAIPQVVMEAVYEDIVLMGAIILAKENGGYSIYSSYYNKLTKLCEQSFTSKVEAMNMAESFE